METYVAVTINAKNWDWLAEYSEHVPQIVRDHGGKYLAVPKGVGLIKVPEGNADAPEVMIFFVFPSMDALQSFLDSPAYAPYRAKRIAATDTNFFAFENDENALQFKGQ